MIPKKIHYCWFGRGKKNKLFYKCLESWKNFFPDYEIIEWNEDNFDINYNNYVKEAYQCKKYAFVSDVARLKVIYEHGGIYFDTDVEVLKTFDEGLLKAGFLGEERPSIINTGLGFAAKPKNKIVKILLDDYDNLNFIKKDGTMDLTPCTERNSNALINMGYEIKSGQKIDLLPIYSKEYIGGFDVFTQHCIVSEKTYTIHHYNASWESPKMKVKYKIKRFISNIVGIDNYYKIRDLKHKIHKKFEKGK